MEFPFTLMGVPVWVGVLVRPLNFLLRRFPLPELARAFVGAFLGVSRDLGAIVDGFVVSKRTVEES